MRPHKSSTKLLRRVTHAFDSAKIPWASEIFNETASTGDAWIRQRKQPLGLRNLQRNCFHGLHMHSTAQTARAASEIFNEIDSTAASEIFNETASTGDTRIRQRKQPMGPQKSTTKLLPLVTHSFDSANSPRGFRNHQRNCLHR
jgi:hypothetical protein